MESGIRELGGEQFREERGQYLREVRATGIREERNYQGDDPKHIMEEGGNP